MGTPTLRQLEGAAPAATPPPVLATELSPTSAHKLASDDGLGGTYGSAPSGSVRPSKRATASVRWHIPARASLADDSTTPLDLVPSLGWKRVLDIFGAVVLLAVFLVPMIIITVMTRADGAPALFRQVRIGHGGKRFACLKFRTMRPNAEQVLKDLLAKDPDARAEWERDRKLRSDPRLTPIGVLLRRTSLDELPQLLNVLRGEMSLVGPRPIVEDELMRYGSRLRWYQAVRPGITGLWQVSGRNDTSYSRRVAFDVLYVRNINLRFDLRILWRTVGVVLGGGGAY